MPAAQFFERGPSRGALQSQLLGQGLGQGAGQIGGQMFARSQLQDALEKVKTDAQQPGAKPLDMQFNLLKALYGVPGGERALAPAMELLTRTMMGKNIETTPPPPGQPGVGQGPGETDRKPSVFDEIKEKNDLSNPSTFYQTAKSQIPDLPEPIQTPEIFHGDLEPSRWGQGPVPNLYSPEQIAQITQEDLSRGYPQSQRAAMMEKYNELARKDVEDKQNAINIRSNIAKQQRESQEAFRNVLSDQYILKGQDLSLAETIANKPEFQKIGNDQIRAERVMEQFKLDKADLDSFDRGSIRPNPYLFKQRYDDAFDNVKNTFNQLAKKGMRSQALEKLAGNGWSTVEIEQISNPLGASLQQLQSLPSLQKQTVGPQAYKGQNEKQVLQNLNKWEKEIPNIFKKGNVDPKNRDVVIPGTSLVLMQNEFMKKGGNYLDFAKIINKLVDQKKIELDPYQQKELNKLNQHPIHIYTLEEYLFGTRNK